ncbi:MAG: methionyl-tRNA formyltransferase [Syntrophales bacterium]
MVAEKPRIIFMGTPEFAVPSLDALVQSGYPVIAVVTQPDRPKGRGRRNEPPPVKTAAEKYGLRVIQPESVRDSSFLEFFRRLAPDMVVLVAFGQILPAQIISYPPKGCINVHPSLLPRYRGAAPINWALIRGDKETGVTVIMMDEKVDSGDILIQENTMIAPEETFGQLRDRLAEMGARLLLRAIEAVVEGTVTGTPQDPSQATYAPRLKKEDGRIHWSTDFSSIVNLIRGLSPAPGAYTCIEGRQLKVFTASGEASERVDGPPGKVTGQSDRGLRIAAVNGYVYLQDVQLEGKKRMPIQDFLRGYKIEPGTVLT